MPDENDLPAEAMEPNATDEGIPEQTDNESETEFDTQIEKITEIPDVEDGKGQE